jgi:hypothetical protein
MDVTLVSELGENKRLGMFQNEMYELNEREHDKEDGEHCITSNFIQDYWGLDFVHLPVF